MILGGLFGGQSFDAGVQAALVTVGGVGVEDALLHTLVEGGGGRLVLLGCGLDVAGMEGLAQGAKASRTRLSFERLTVVFFSV